MVGQWRVTLFCSEEHNAYQLHFDQRLLSSTSRHSQGIDRVESINGYIRFLILLLASSMFGQSSFNIENQNKSPLCWICPTGDPRSPMQKVQEGNVTHCDKKQREETEVQNIKNCQWTKVVVLINNVIPIDSTDSLVEAPDVKVWKWGRIWNLLYCGNDTADRVRGNGEGKVANWVAMVISRGSKKKIIDAAVIKHKKQNFFHFHCLCVDVVIGRGVCVLVYNTVN